MSDFSDEPALIIKATGISKTYNEAADAVTIFENLDFQLKVGESVGILGSSGSGKTTLLNILGGLDKASFGSVEVCGVKLDQSSSKAITKLRNSHLGFVYQFHHLLPEFSATENVAMPLYISGMKRKDADKKALELLDLVGLSHRVKHKPSELSGGERQRVAIARALVNDPKCVMMDEPTGNLDEGTAGKIQELMVDLQGRLGTSFVLVTHDKRLAHTMDKVFLMELGKLKPVE
jgi:lipoprotein-releasing system ATP-binding protein|tara:strand:+ start:70 stop:771 length:702 start_codon:yes stop_codon:yes gene_type:complete